MTNEQRCQKRISDHTGFTWWPCGKPAKFIATHGDRQTFVCGVHANVYRRWKDAQVSALENRSEK